MVTLPSPSPHAAATSASSSAAAAARRGPSPGDGTVTARAANGCAATRPPPSSPPTSTGRSRRSSTTPPPPGPSTAPSPCSPTSPRRYGAVAVLSGRPVAFLQQWLPAAVELRGLYGLEVVRDGERHDHATAGAWRSVVDEVAASTDLPRHQRRAQGPSRSPLHFRTDPTAAAEAAWAEAAAERTGLALRPARMSIELHPPVAVDKGTALRRAGDDGRGDGGVLHRRRRRRPPGVHRPRRAGRRGPLVDAVPRRRAQPRGAPPLLERADVVVDGPDGVVELLRSLS